MRILDSATDGPLHGVRVIDASQALAGPYAGRLLADLGADVIKLESPDGDISRVLGPRGDRGMSGLYTFTNVGKRNVSIDLKRTEGAALLLDLVRVSQVLIENYLPGVAERLGFGWEVVHCANPALVMLSISGYGQDSSWRERRAFAPVVHAEAGVIHHQAEHAGQEVVALMNAYADTNASLHGTVAVLAALRTAERTGEGQHIDLAMFDALLASHSETFNVLQGEAPTSAEIPVLDAGPHGKLVIAGAVQFVWKRLREVFPAEIPDPTPAGADVATKFSVRRGAIEKWLASHPTREALFAKLDRARLAFGLARPMLEALRGPVAAERGVLVAVDDRRGGTREVPNTPYHFSRDRAGLRGPAPLQGEHNREVLADLLGLDEARLGALESALVLHASDARFQSKTRSPV